MRVTQNTMTQSLVRYLTAQNEALYDRQTIIASQKRINKPSDDPIAMGKVLDYRQTLASIDQYQTNIQTGKTRLDETESTLKLVDDLLQVLRAIGQTESGSTNESRQLAAEEVKKLYDQVLDLANATQNDSYMFSGYLTKTAPFSRDDTQPTTFDQYTVSYNGDTGDASFIVAKNTELTLDADGQPIFHNAAAGGVNIFDHIRDLIVGLENNDTDAISAQTGMLDQARTQVNNIRAANASTYYQLEITERHWQNYKPKIQDLMAKEEEADITKAVVELQNIELAYQTTLATAARIIQPGLVQFLK
ncbi:MAG: flagellar hook-associated protein FlgL [Deltaproteobacteria bacterium]|nr:flagellar hook-associated protein FlgL [Deltaproteobacteria bacterium]